MMAVPCHLPNELDDRPDRSGGGNGAASKTTQSVTGVRYGAMKWTGEFQLPPNTGVKPGGSVVVQTDRGIELGEQLELTRLDCEHCVNRTHIQEYVDNSGGEFYRLKAGRVLRKATPQDVDEHERLNSHVREDVQRCASLAAEMNLGMKVVTAEHLLGGERIVFYFRSEERVDFRDLVRELARYYQTRIEMRQVGARDEARLVADYEVCGRECCCRTFLKKLRPVTMRMAKLQKSTLDPTKVSGRCGRLRCCLRYEHEGYDELLRRLPRTGARVQTESGPATVIDRQVLTQLLLVRGDDDREMTIPVEEVSLLEAPGRRPAALPPDAEPTAAPSDLPEPAEEPPEEQSRGRRRPRRRSRPRADEPGVPDEAAAAEPPASEAPAGSPDTHEVAGAGAEDTGQPPEEAPRPRRRRRRRRRPRRRPDSPSERNKG